MKKRGQVKLSFGMIFSIILIITFIAFAIYAIIKFIDFQEKIKITKFAAPDGDLQKNVNSAQKEYKQARTEEYFLPSKIEFVCFADFNYGERGPHASFYGEIRKYSRGENNLFFYPPESASGFPAANIEHINITLMTLDRQENPYCIETEEGKIRLVLQKEFGENLVVISRE